MSVPDSRYEMIPMPAASAVSDLSKVDEQLAGLYRRTAGAEEGEVSVSRSLLLNLIAYATSASDADEAAAYVSEVSGSHPCRAVVIEDTASAGDKPVAQVSVVCGVTPRGDRRLCGEIIRLQVHGNRAALAGSVLPLLVPDVPVVLWATRDLPASGGETDELLRVSDQLIFDSGRVSDLRAAYDRAFSLCVPGEFPCVVRDLQWIALEPWRELTAQHFDHPAALPYLGEVRRVIVTYHSGDSSVPSAPMLWAAWFMFKAGIEPRAAVRTGQDCVLQAEQAGRTVEVCFAASEEARGTLSNIRIECELDGRHAHFVTKHVSDDQLFISQDCVDLCLPPQQIELPSQRPSALVGRALDTYRLDSLFTGSLAVARELIDILSGVER